MSAILIVRSIPSFYEQLVRDALRPRAEDFHADRQENKDKLLSRPGRNIHFAQATGFLTHVQIVHM